MKDVKMMIKEEMEKYRDEDRQQEAGQCIMGEMRKDREDSDWKEKYNKEHKLRQEAEGELTIVKGISVHMSPEMRDAQKKITELQNSLDRFKKENNDCYNRIAEALEVNESHQKLNGKLQERLTEVEEDNKKLASQVEDKVNQLRKSGVL
mgnify:CR=1 FL=1